jgi:hypothetical protein
VKAQQIEDDEVQAGPTKLALRDPVSDLSHHVVLNDTYSVVDIYKAEPAMPSAHLCSFAVLRRTLLVLHDGADNYLVMSNM